MVSQFRSAQRYPEVSHGSAPPHRALHPFRPLLDPSWYFPDHNDPSQPAPRLCAKDSADLTYGLRVAKVRGFQFKDLRRTAATLLAREGVDRRIVSRILAHKDRSITAVYDQYSYDREVRDGMMRLEKRLRKILGGQLDGGENG